jgi:hypothetical protein
MDWITLQGRMARDRDFPDRAFRLTALEAVLNGRQYDSLPFPFSMERTAGGEYIPLDSRRPSVKTGLCRVVVEDAVSLLFSEGHWPSICANHGATASALDLLVQETLLKQTMLEAATLGAVGSVAVHLRVLEGKVFFDVTRTAFLTPMWQPDDPRELREVVERYKVSAAELAVLGYDVDPGSDLYWFERKWDSQSETWYLPRPINDKTKVVDTQRSVRHGLGFVPIVWIKNLPGEAGPGADGPDGGCTFEAAIDTVIETDYLLSQAGRGLKYGSDPTLVLKDPSAGLGAVQAARVGGAASALTLPPEGDAKLLEINGSAATAVLAHVQELRSIALEAIHGNRAHGNRLSAPQSGRAIELLCQGLIWLADRLRISYGESGLVRLMRMVCRASQRVRGGIVIGGTRFTSLDESGLCLRWPEWFPASASERQAQAATLCNLVEAGIMSRRSALSVIAPVYGVANPDTELESLQEDQDAHADRG